MKILIVDDNKDITDLLSRFLKSKGFETVIANDPFDGLDQMKEEKFNVVLLDMSMPEFSGIDIIDSLDREKILQDQKIIIFSAITHTSSQINAFSERKGIHGYLKKPIELNKLLTAITS